MKGGFESWDLRAEGAGRAYDVLSNLVVPRPIAFVSTLSADGVANLAPFSYFNLGGVSPPSLVFCTVLGSGGAKKDTLRNIEETGEYVVNLVTREMAEGMNETSGAYPHDFDEWAVSGFTRLASEVVAPARVGESAVQFECRLFQVVGHGDGAGAGRYVIGEVARAHVRSDVVEGGLAGFAPISRLGGPDYLDLASGERFGMSRPRVGG